LLVLAPLPARQVRTIQGAGGENIAVAATYYACSSPSCPKVTERMAKAPEKQPKHPGGGWLPSDVKRHGLEAVFLPYGHDASLDLMPLEARVAFRSYLILDGSGGVTAALADLILRPDVPLQATADTLQTTWCHVGHASSQQWTRVCLRHAHRFPRER
jgi:hypothetical protein